MSSTPTPTYELEVRAAEQRKRLHDSVAELKTQVRDRLDVKKNAREHLGAAAGIASVMALLAGYGVAGMFTRH
jgi:hypothetical protein